MSSTIKLGELSISVFGESHGAGIGVAIDGLPPAEKIDLDKINTFMARRAPKKDGTSTMRNEKDIPEIISGLYNGKTTGNTLCALIRNTDMHSDDYKSVSTLARPAHADYTGSVRYKGANDLRGGGHFSGRLTATLVFAGAVCGQILERRGIYSCAHISSIMNVFDDKFNTLCVDRELMSDVKCRYLPLINADKDAAMRAVIEEARTSLDSVGGGIECAVTGLAAGIGSPVFDGIENRISQIVFAIPAIKGIAFGAGFDVCGMRGSENNDEMYIKNGQILSRTNNAGGILGGISNGMPIIFEVAVKPTPSIAQPQKTVDYVKMTDEILEIKGRHDPCIVPRAVPCVEAAANIAVLSLL